jgi:processing peptidase subunit beta
MVLAGAGGVNHEELCNLATKHFGKITDKYDAEVPLDMAMRYTGKLEK